MEYASVVEGLTRDQWLAMLVAAVIAAIVGYLYRWYQERNTIGSAELRRDQILENARREAELIKGKLMLEGREELLKEQQNVSRDLDKQKLDHKRVEDRVKQKEDQLNRRSQELSKSEQEIKRSQEKLLVDQKAAETFAGELKAKLEKISSLTADEARSMLIQSIEDEAQAEAARRVRMIEQEADRDAEERSKKILTVAIQRYASEVTAERTVSSVSLPSDELKGRIIGREGRNIREFERLSGVDLVIDDTPQAVHLSCFDPVRREIARLALTKLVADGRIHPSRIEELLEKSKKEIDQLIRKAADEAAYAMGIHNLRPEVMQILGRLKYRTSYGQNILAHSMEVAHIGGLIAAEMGMDVPVIKRSCLLHDIGKAVDHEMEGPHAIVGAELLKKYGESPTVVAAVAGHHGEVEMTLESILVQVADAISASRPGVRMESADMYVKRLEALEKIAQNEPGVEKAYAIQAGREVRILVNHQQVSDGQAKQVAKTIAKKIEDELEYPGQIRVTVIRETKFTDYAR
ncbi:MAG: ribonuclease Y [Candidatus Hydrogenedentota bacterium]